MVFRRGEGEGLMRNRRQTTFRDEQSPKKKKIALPNCIHSKSPTQLSNICFPHPLNMSPTVIQPAMLGLPPNIKQGFSQDQIFIRVIAISYCTPILCHIWDWVPFSLCSNSVKLVHYYAQRIRKPRLFKQQV